MRSLLFFLSLAAFLPSGWAQEAENRDLQPYIETVQQVSQGMTLWQVLQSGGVVMIILGILSLVMITLAIFLFLKLSPARLVPLYQAERVIEHVEQKNYRQALEECMGKDNIVSTIAISGLNQLPRGLTSTEEALELTARKEVAGLWASLHYLSDIAQIAPMLGLLGTVLGMIQAFNTIAFETAVVKPILLAGGVSKAMITTAAGLSVAITAMIFYSILRTRVQHITNIIQTITSQLLESFRK